MSRKPLVAGNWKMHLSPAEGRAFAEEFVPLAGSALAAADVVVAPTSLGLAGLAEALTGSGVAVAAQDVHWEAQGAFTGEVSPELIRSAGASFALVGHSERRQLFGESDDHVRRKTVALQRAGLVPIVCVGETLAEREAGQLKQVLERQLVYGLEGVEIAHAARFVIAYEPVWAIGTGRTAGPTDAQEAHAFLRSVLIGLYGTEVADGIRLLYGGSVKPDNARELAEQRDVDGVLVGGASLAAASFAAILEGVVRQRAAA